MPALVRGRAQDRRTVWAGNRVARPLYGISRDVWSAFAVAVTYANQSAS